MGLVVRASLLLLLCACAHDARPPAPPDLDRDALPSWSEQIRIRDAQCRYPGGVFSLELRGGKRSAFELLRRLRIARNAVSLGGVETLACHPATTCLPEVAGAGLLLGHAPRLPAGAPADAGARRTCG